MKFWSWMTDGSLRLDRPGCQWLFLGSGGNQDLNEGAPARLTVDFDAPTHGLDEPVDQAHPQASAFAKAADEGDEELLQLLGGHATAVVRHRETDALLVEGAGQTHHGGRLPIHGLAGIHEEVQEQAVEAGNVNQPLGTLFGKHQAFTVQASGQLNDAAAFRPMIVAYRNGSPVRLQQLGNVLDSVQNDKAAAWYNNTRAVVLAVQRQPGANTVAVVDNIKKLLPQFRNQIPATV